MIPVVFDGRYIKPHSPDGISQFSLGLIRELRKLTPLTVLVSSQAQKLEVGEGVEFFQIPPVTSPLEVFTALKLNRLGAKVVFSPMQTTSGLGRRYRLILTLHDLIYYRHRTPPREFNPLIRIGWFLFHLTFWPQRMLLNSADAVVTVSETSRRQIIKAKLTKRPIHVIHNAPTELAKVDSNRADSDLVVYMGSFIGYKNVETVIEAVAQAGLRLALLSRIDAKRQQELERLASEVGAEVIFVGGVSEAEYAQWLGQARALVSASLDEGFGIPAVEAMSTGCPVVLSDLEIFQEVAGKAGVFFRPKDSAQLADRLNSLSNPTFWKQQSELALAQAKNFSWQQSAQKLKALIDELST